MIVLGLDGFDPVITERLMASGRLRALASLRANGTYSRLATTTPAQTPVAWSTFATGQNPGQHGIYDFLRRDPATYHPDLALCRFERRSALLPPQAVNLRSGIPIWEHLSNAGIPSTVLRHPCTFPPAPFNGRLLAGMGVPDLRGGLGTAAFFTTDRGASTRDGEDLVFLEGRGPGYRANLRGPRAGQQRDLSVPLEITVERGGNSARVQLTSRGPALALRRGEWSDHQRVRFPAGLFSTVSGILQFILVSTTPHVELYASPLNFDPAAPLFPISHPHSYARELSERQGTYHTLGMPEDHTGLTNERVSESEFLAQCDGVLSERERMLQDEMSRLDRGLLFCLFDTPDRIQHMFWRSTEPEHPANQGRTAREFAQVIDDHYERCDRIVAEVLRVTDDRTLVMVLSDHGFTSFRRGVNLNRWLVQAGWMKLKDNSEPGGDFFHDVDWGGTRAYALGFGSVYLNLAGREGEGIVSRQDRAAEASRLAGEITGLEDPRGGVAVVGANSRDELYSGSRIAEAPDVVVRFASGYRASWGTALGGAPMELFEDNTRKWAGDHIVDPLLVPGVLFVNREMPVDAPRLMDCTATILDELGAVAPPEAEGTSFRAR